MCVAHTPMLEGAQYIWQETIDYNMQIETRHKDVSKCKNVKSVSSLLGTTDECGHQFLRGNVEFRMEVDSNV